MSENKPGGINDHEGNDLLGAAEGHYRSFKDKVDEEGAAKRRVEVATAVKELLVKTWGAVADHEILITPEVKLRPGRLERRRARKATDLRSLSYDSKAAQDKSDVWREVSGLVDGQYKRIWDLRDEESEIRYEQKDAIAAGNAHYEANREGYHKAAVEDAEYHGHDMSGFNPDVEGGQVRVHPVEPEQ